MRKVLSFVLVLALVLSSFSMAFAADTAKAGLTDIAGNANADAIQVNYDLGIVTGNPDGTFLPGKDVTRAEFAAMLTRALNIPDSALAGYTATTFKDTAGYGWAVSYLAFCQSKGILLGDGNGNVMPGKTITVNEAMTMALRAIGYTANSSLLVGAWPANYVSIAQNNDLYDDVAKTITVNKANAAQIIYNLLTVQKVTVNSDGATNFLSWSYSDGSSEAQNLLNTNLNCTSDPDVILGSDYTYDDAVINITKDLGAYGTAYLNDDEELIAFTKDSTALTGYVDGTDFVVGDEEYSFGANVFTAGAFIANTVADDQNTAISRAGIEAWAAANVSDNDGEVTLNVDLSGKKIKDIYSVVGWEVTFAEMAESDVQEDIADDTPTLLGAEFALTDDDEIDMNSFKLVGAASLDKIAEDDVVYVYTENTADDYIRLIAVGTETVEGVVDEMSDDEITIAEKEYGFQNNITEAISISAIDIDDEGTFYLDYQGKVFDFDGTTSTDTYGVVKSYAAETSFDNFKIKLYKSDDSTKTLYLSEDDPADIEWTSTGAATVSGIVTGAMIGYALDADGYIDTINNEVITSGALGAELKSNKVIEFAGEDYDIASNVVVFSYTGNPDSGDYDIATIGEVDKDDIAINTTTFASIILNDDGDVAALLVSDTVVDADEDSVYGVFNSRTSTKDADDTKVFKFKGFIDGTAFTKLTDDDDAGDYGSRAGQFDVYEIVVDTNDVITDVKALGLYTAGSEASGALTPVGTTVQIKSLSSDKTVITAVGDTKYTVDDDAIVYKYSVDDEEFTVSKLSSLQKDYFVRLYDAKGDDADGSASIVIFYED